MSTETRCRCGHAEYAHHLEGGIYTACGFFGCHDCERFEVTDELPPREQGRLL